MQISPESTRYCWELITENQQLLMFLILSDVHGNRFGLEAVLESARGEYSQVLCLGDVVGYGAHPNECCEILRAANARCLLGNHDAAALGQIDIEWFNPVAKAAILWTRAQLSAENRAWLETLSPQMEDESARFQAVHASLRQPIEEYIIDPQTAQPTFSLMTQPLCFYGHTHVAEVYRQMVQPGTKYEMQHAGLTYGGEVQMENGWSYLVNSGSCGQPRDGNPQARYAFFDEEKRDVEVFAIDYDWRAAAQAIFDAGLPRVLGERLGRGR